VTEANHGGFVLEADWLHAVVEADGGNVPVLKATFTVALDEAGLAALDLANCSDTDDGRVGFHEFKEAKQFMKA
jgi:hypothetical protein